MKAAEDGRRYDAAHVLDGAMNRGVLVERPMSPQPYNRWRTSSESGVSALRPKQPDGRRTRVGSIRSAFRRSRSEGDPGAMGLSRMPMARNRRVTAAP